MYQIKVSLHQKYGGDTEWEEIAVRTCESCFETFEEARREMIADAQRVVKGEAAEGIVARYVDNGPYDNARKRTLLMTHEGFDIRMIIEVEQLTPVIKLSDFGILIS